MRNSALVGMALIAGSAWADPISISVLNGSAQAWALAAGPPGVICSNQDNVTGVGVTATAQCGMSGSPGSASNPAVVSAEAGELSAQIGVNVIFGNGQFATAGGNASASTTETLLVTGGQGAGYIAFQALGTAPVIGSASINSVSLYFVSPYLSDAIGVVFPFQYGQPFPLTISTSAGADNGGVYPSTEYGNIAVGQIQILSHPSPYNGYANLCLPTGSGMDCGQLPLYTTTASDLAAPTTPEPESVLLIASGLIALLIAKRRLARTGNQAATRGRREPTCS